MSQAGTIKVTDFGAVGDNHTDNTRAFQQALDAAAESRGTVFVPDGVYLCGRLAVPPHVGLVGNATWGYREGGGSVLVLNDDQANCLLDISGAVGATMNGLSLRGNRQMKTRAHGIYMGPIADKKEEDSPRIERCHISNFNGDGIHLAPVWCFSVRSCEVIHNGGDALHVCGWDGFILDNWFSGNEGAGYAAVDNSASVTMTGNRIEWNGGGGIRLHGACHYNITGNYIDRSGGPAIRLTAREPDSPCFCLTITGNVIYRSGRPEWTDSADPLESAHVRLERAHGLVFTGNSMCVGQDDGGGEMSPKIGMVLRALQNSVVKDNTLHLGALEDVIRDLGQHEGGVIIRDNVGSLFQAPAGTSIWNSGLL